MFPWSSQSKKAWNWNMKSQWGYMQRTGGPGHKWSCQICGEWHHNASCQKCRTCGAQRSQPAPMPQWENRVPAPWQQIPPSVKVPPQQTKTLKPPPAVAEALGRMKQEKEDADTEMAEVKTSDLGGDSLKQLRAAHEGLLVAGQNALAAQVLKKIKAAEGPQLQKPNATKKLAQANQWVTKCNGVVEQAKLAVEQAEKSLEQAKQALAVAEQEQQKAENIKMQFYSELREQEEGENCAAEGPGVAPGEAAKTAGSLVDLMRAGDAGTIDMVEWNKQVSDNLQRLVTLLAPKHAETAKRQREADGERRPASKPKVVQQEGPVFVGISG